MRDERGGVPGEQALRQLAHHRVLDIRFGDRGAIDVLPVARASRDDPSTLQSGDECRDGGLSQAALLVQGLPELGHGRFAAVPEQAEDGELQLGDLVTIRHERSCDLQM